MSSPSLSVILPVHDEPTAYLISAIDSILSQDYPLIELLIVLSDASASVQRDIRSRLGNTERATVLQASVPGAAAARNLGIRAASGDYLLFCDADDCYLPASLTVLAKTLQENPVDLLIAFCSGQLTGEDDAVFACDMSLLRGLYLDEPLAARALPSPWNGQRLFLHRCFGIAYRTGFLRENGLYFPEQYAVLEALPFLYHCLQKGNTACLLRHTVYQKNARIASLSLRADLPYIQDLDHALAALTQELAGEPDGSAAFLLFRLLLLYLRAAAGGEDAVTKQVLSRLERPEVKRLAAAVRPGPLDLSPATDALLQRILTSLREGRALFALTLYRALFVSSEE